jgi:chromosome segregation ATPase
MPSLPNYQIIKLQNKQDEVRNVRDYDYYESEINEIQERIDQRNEELDLLASDITALNNEYSRYYNTELRNARLGKQTARSGIFTLKGCSYPRSGNNAIQLPEQRVRFRKT